ncbi:MAG: 2-amino-4-hydroxy-6-hydroxymethyldihydropteridine diphosphokinase [Clostridia bacterium]
MYLGLGSNAGESAAILDAALVSLGSFISQPRASSLYRTSPRYILDQPDFLNLVLTGLVDIEPGELLDRTQKIEASFGRDRSRERPKGERTLDIDILMYGSLVMDTERLKIPHPGMLERAFVLVPLLELDPELVHPGTGIRFAEVLPSVRDQGIYLHDKAAL